MLQSSEKIILLVFFIFFNGLIFNTSNLQAQSYKKDKKRWKTVSTHASVGVAYSEKFSDFSHIADYIDFPADYTLPTGYNWKKGCAPYCNYYQLAIPLQVNFGLSFVRLKNGSQDYNNYQELRVGLSAQFRSENIDYLSETPITDDTLSYNTLQWRLVQFEPAIETTWLFSTNPLKRASVYTGLGQKTGFGMSSRLDQLQKQGTSLILDGGSDRYVFTEVPVEDNIRTRFPVTFRMFLPVGFRLKFNDKLQLFTEADGGFSYRMLFGKGGKIFPYLAGTIGLRIIWK